MSGQDVIDMLIRRSINELRHDPIHFIVGILATAALIAAIAPCMDVILPRSAAMTRLVSSYHFIDVLIQDIIAGVVLGAVLVKHGPQKLKKIGLSVFCVCTALCAVYGWVDLIIK